jgi:hypothetical protein
MALRAKKPEAQPNRFRAVIFGAPSAGKSHFVTNLPDVYYIDTENLQKYKKFREMLDKNGGHIVSLNDMSDIINEVKELLSTKHNYKTLVIDSISVPCGHLANLEVDRLVKASVKPIEGTEFGSNVAKPKRLTYHLGMLLARLDMNVIVTAHEKAKFEGAQEVGKIPDVSDKLAYLLGTTIHIQNAGGKRIGRIIKSRYTELTDGESINLDNGYETLKSRFGEDVFLREAILEKLCTKEQLSEISRLATLRRIPEETQQKWLTKFSSNSFQEISEINAQKIIVHLKSLEGEENV